MAVKRHLRLTWGGQLPGNELWQSSLSLVPDNSVFMTAAFGGLGAAARELLNTNLDLFADVVTDVQNFHNRAASGIQAGVVLRWVKLAPINEEGRYAAEPLEAAVNTPGGSAAFGFPNQCARKITLLTEGDLGRVKGGFYVPGCTVTGYDLTTQMYSVNDTELLRLATAEFIDDLENAPGIDFSSLRVVVASSGRHNKNGTVRVGPENHDVKAVTVGRRVDIVRRRANAIPENYVAPSSV